MPAAGTHCSLWAESPVSLTMWFSFFNKKLVIQVVLVSQYSAVRLSVCNPSLHLEVWHCIWWQAQQGHSSGMCSGDSHSLACMGPANGGWVQLSVCHQTGSECQDIVGVLESPCGTACCAAGVQQSGGWGLERTHSLPQSWDLQRT